MKTVFGVLFKVLLALGAVFAVLALLRRFGEKQDDYIEIYNDDDDWGGDFY